MTILRSSVIRVSLRRRERQREFVRTVTEHWRGGCSVPGDQRRSGDDYRHCRPRRRICAAAATAAAAAVVAEPQL